MLEIGGCQKTPLLSLLKEGEAVALFWLSGAILRPPKPPLELLATSVVARKVADKVDPPELLATAGAVAGAGSKSQLLRVVILLFMLLRKCVGLCFEAAFDFELRRKELMRRLDYGICILR
ncbi:uncharacterized protein DS421_7g216340 [Arachis hypogaea]|nr:uncharacterized protein DS421_7g216340 [Arachis hypogaea]